jgi:hypothetical protein
MKLNPQGSRDNTAKTKLIQLTASLESDENGDSGGAKGK